MGKTSRIVYAPKTRRKTSSPDRNQSASSNAQGSEEKSERKKSRRRSRIAYDPKSRRKRKSSNAPLLNLEVKQGPQRNKRRGNDTATTSLESSHHKQPKRKKGSTSSSDEKSSSCKHSTPELIKAASEVTHKQSTVTKKRVYQRRKPAKQADATPEHIRDITVTKKTYAKWKPLSSLTKKYTEQVLESTVLSVLNGVGKESKKRGIQVHLTHLSERIIKRLEGIKGPVHRGDYSKMEAESHELQDAVISYNKQIEALEKELAEQTRLFDQDEQMLNNFSDQQQEVQHLSQLHPLLQREPVITLNLPSMSDEATRLSTVYQIPSSLQGHAGRLAQSLARISDRAEQVGFTNWLEVLSTRNNAHLNS